MITIQIDEAEIGMLLRALIELRDSEDRSAALALSDGRDEDYEIICRHLVRINTRIDDLMVLRLAARCEGYIAEWCLMVYGHRDGLH